MTTDDTRPPLLLVIQPDAQCPLHEMGSWLSDDGVRVRLVRPFEGDRVPGRVDGDGLVVLGGDMSAHDDVLHPWLEDVRSLQRSAAEDGLPSLGICLGAQLMAQAFGGRTGVGERGLEAGIADVDWLPEAAGDPVFADLAAPFPAPMMHRDAITTLPPDATLLGSGSLYPHQAFRVGSTSWAVQFHPEADRHLYDGWAAVMPDAAPEARQRLAEGSRAFARRESEVLRSNRALVRSFARVTRGAVSARRGGIE